MSLALDRDAHPLLRDLVALHCEDPALMRAMDSELGALDREESFEGTDPHIERLSRDGRRLRFDPATTSWLLVLVVLHVSRWLVHSAPKGVDRESALGRSIAHFPCQPV